MVGSMTVFVSRPQIMLISFIFLILVPLDEELLSACSVAIRPKLGFFHISTLFLMNPPAGASLLLQHSIFSDIVHHISSIYLTQISLFPSL